MIGLTAATLALTALAAQGPTRAPEDLAQLANHLDTEGSVAAILALYPKDAATELIASAKQLTPASARRCSTRSNRRARWSWPRRSAS